MEKCEKEERFEEAAIARDRILKLKKIENKKILQDLELKQQESIFELDQNQNEELMKFDEELAEQEKRIKEEKEKCRILLENKHFTEKQGLYESFEAKYPSQPKFSPEVLNLQKVMEGHIKNKEYEKANEIKIKILDLCEEQDMKHRIDMKNKKLEVELNKIKQKHSNEINNLLSKWDTTLLTFLKKENINRDKLILKYQNKFRELQKKHNTQRIEQERVNKKNLVFKSPSLRLSRKFNFSLYTMYYILCIMYYVFI